MNEIEKLKSKLDSYKPFNLLALKSLEEDLIVRYTYHSNAIEGNTLSLYETKIALEGVTVGGKTLREHFEAINHKEAILFIENLSQKSASLNELDIKQIHALILKNIDDKNSGKYRDINVLISGAKHTPPNHYEVAPLMQKFIKDYQSKKSQIHPVELAAFVHIEFVKIHPFVDGNGRAARLLTNLELIRSGYPPVIFEVENRLEYYKALDLAHTADDYSLFIDLMKNALKISFERWLFALS